MANPSAGDLLSKLRDRTASEPVVDQGSGNGRLERGSASTATLQRRFAPAVGLALVTLVLAQAAGTATASRWVQLLAAGGVVFWATWPVQASVIDAARRRTWTWDTLASIGIVGAFVWSVVELLKRGPDLAFHIAAGLAVLLVGGRLLEARGRAAALTHLRALDDVSVKDVAVLRIHPQSRITSESRTPIAGLVIGDQFIVRAGERIASDGVVLDGTSSMDASAVTGATAPTDVTVGDSVVGGATNIGGRLVVETRALGPDTGIARLGAAVRDAGRSGHSTRAVGWVVPAVLVIAVIALIAWLATGHTGARSWGAALAVLVIAGPAALVLATATARLVGTGRAASLGAIITGPRTIENAHRVDTVVLDQAGTVTTGRLQLRSIAVRGALSKKSALTAAAAVEQGSDHPIARAIVAGAELARIELPRIRDFGANPGEGASARIKDTEVTVGKAALFEEIDDSLLAHASERAGSTVFVGWNGRAEAALTLEDTVRTSSRAAIAQLSRLGLTTHLLSPDPEASAASIAAQVGIDPGKVRSGIRRADQAAVVADLKRQGRTVAFVGGPADAAALAEADLPISLAPHDQPGISLVRADLSAVGDALAIARATHTTARRNATFATAYNVVAVPVAAAGLVHPLIAGAAGAASSLLVVAHSLRLRRA